MAELDRSWWNKLKTLLLLPLRNQANQAWVAFAHSAITKRWKERVCIYHRIFRDDLYRYNATIKFLTEVRFKNQTRANVTFADFSSAATYGCNCSCHRRILQSSPTANFCSWFRIKNPWCDILAESIWGRGFFPCASGVSVSLRLWHGDTGRWQSAKMKTKQLVVTVSNHAQSSGCAVPVMRDLLQSDAEAAVAVSAEEQV